MKRTVVLALLLIVVVASISGTNAAFSQQVVLPSDAVVLATPTAAPSPTPTPPQWTGEFELVIRFDDIWRSQGPERLLGNINYELYNHTGRGTIAAVDAIKWEVTFNANFSINSIHSASFNKLAPNRYAITNASWDPAKPDQPSLGPGGGVSTYDLTKMINGVKTRTTNPTFHELIFSNASLRIATESYNGPLIQLAPNRLKITFMSPPPLSGWVAQWEDGVVYPPGWVLVH